MLFSSPNRRSFLFAFAGSVLGPFFVPLTMAPTGEGESATDLKEVELPADMRDETDQVIRRVIGRVQMDDTPEGPMLLWVEEFPDGTPTPKPTVMIWFPHTESEHAEAKRFYEASRWKPYASFQDLQNQPRQTGPFVVRYCVYHGKYLCYLRTLEEKFLKTESPLSQIGNPDVWCEEPQEAITLNHDQAIYFTMRMMKALEISIRPEEHSIIEPLPLASAAVLHEKYMKTFARRTSR